MPAEYQTFFDGFDPQAVFAPGLTAPAELTQDVLWFLFRGDQLLVVQRQAVNGEGAGSNAPAPFVAGTNALDIKLQSRQYLGCWNTSDSSLHCFSGELAEDCLLPAECTTVDLRSLFGVWEERWIAVAGRAKQVAHWERDHRYCSRCGAATEGAAGERARRCPHCGLTSYPRISPAIIIAVRRKMEDGEKILLARNHRFPAGRYSVVAGFVEVGETLEECARREVMEEVGIQIDAIHYFGSQSWPFPNSLMIGFVADYAGGEINLDDSEIAEAGWFSPDAMPQLPPKISIARQLIDSFLATAAVDDRLAFL